MRLRELTEAERKFHGLDGDHPSQALAIHYIDEDTGNNVTEIHQKPVRYKDASDKWQHIDLLWEDEPGFGKKVKKAAHNLRIFKNGQNDKLRFGFKKSVYVEYGLPGEPIVNGTEATIIIDQNTDIVYHSVPEGIKADFILKTPTAQRVFTFPVELSAAVAMQQGNSLVFIETLTGRVIGQISPPFAVDANGERGEVALAYAGNQVMFTVDPDWINDPIRTFPVTIDPTTVTIQPDGTVSADTYIQDVNGNSNFGTQSYLYLGRAATDITRMLFTFDLSSIPASKTILSANLGIYVYSVQATTSYAYNAHKITASWVDTTVTWNNAPSYDATIEATTNISTSAAWYSFNILALVQGWYAGTITNYGVLLKGNNEGTTTSQKTAYSSEYNADSTKRPKLTVIWTTAPSVSALTPGNTNISTPTKITTLTPALSWTSDPGDIGETQASYQVVLETAVGGAIRDTGEVASSSTTYNVQANDFSLGNKYRWKVRIKDSEGIWSPYSSYYYVYTNQAPNAPTGLSPASNQVIDAAAANNFAWTFQDADTGNVTEAQTAYQLIITKVSDGSTIVDTGKVSSATAQRTVTGGTLVNGVDYQWKVRTWDNSDVVGAYSSLASFRTGTPPNPTMSSPTNGGTYDKGILTADWNYSDAEGDAQVKYRAVLKQAGAVIEDSQEVASADTAHAFATVLDDNTSYSLEITVWDATDQSSTVTATFTTDFIAPPTPTIVVTPDSANAKITVTITNPAPGGGEPDTNKNYVYRECAAEGKIRIASNVAKNGTYVDYAVASGVQYTYTAVAVSAGETTAESTGDTGSITFLGVWLHDPTDPAGTVYNFKLDWVGRNSAWEATSAALTFDGRVNPLVEFGQFENESVDFGLQMKLSDADYSTMQALVKRKAVLCYRDGRGRKVFGTISAMPATDGLFHYTTQLKLLKNSYSEAV